MSPTLLSTVPFGLCKCFVVRLCPYKLVSILRSNRSGAKTSAMHDFEADVSLLMRPKKEEGQFGCLVLGTVLWLR